MIEKMHKIIIPQALDWIREQDRENSKYRRIYFQELGSLEMIKTLSVWLETKDKHLRMAS
jgi:hypothetical protein